MKRRFARRSDEDGVAALKFVATLVLVPFSFVYVPELLLHRTTQEVAVAAARYVAGYPALAFAIQGTEVMRGAIAPWRRACFGVVATRLLFPLLLLGALAGLTLLAVAWVPSFAEIHRAQSAGQTWAPLRRSPVTVSTFCAMTAIADRPGRGRSDRHEPATLPLSREAARAAPRRANRPRAVVRE